MMQDYQYVQTSILDRLIDLNPEVSNEPVQDNMFNIGQIKASVRGNLENLLNARRMIGADELSDQDLNASLLSYGLRDFTSCNPESQSVRQKLRHDIEKMVSQFEPRLKNVSVRVGYPGKTDRLIKFSIAGILVVKPLSEPVNFDTYLDINRGEYKIQK